MVNFLQYGFIQNAMLSGGFVAIVCAILGVFLISRRMSLIGDGLSHISLLGIAIGLLLNKNPLLITLPVVILASLLILKLTEKAKIYGDSAIGILSAAAISMALVLASIADGFNVDLFNFLFGNILAVSRQEVLVSFIFSALLIFIVFKFYRQIVATTIDQDYAKTLGINVKLINNLLVIMTSCAVVLALKTAGIMLVSAMIIIPSAGAMQIARNIKQTLFFAAAFGAISVILGIILSFFFNLPASAAIILINLLILAITFIIKSSKA